MASPDGNNVLKPPIMTDTIQINSLERSFKRGDSTVQALSGLDLTIARGEFIALVGPSGSGKSTLLNLLGGLDRPTAGELWLNGLALHEATAEERTRHRKERLGFVFQSFNLIDELTVFENIELPLIYLKYSAAERKKRVEEVMEHMKIMHRRNHFPQQLSGGQQQRVAISRAVVAKPKLILADEPTGNLDGQTAESVFELILEMNKEFGTAFIIVTHDMALAERIGSVYRLHDGCLTAVDTI